jgi:hypothetical protein
LGINFKMLITSIERKMISQSNIITLSEVGEKLASFILPLRMLLSLEWGKRGKFN